MWKDSETNIDLLDFDYLVDTLNSLIENDNLTPSSIGVYGDWGSGKSSLITMSNEILSKKENYLCIKFNGWLFESFEDVKTSLMYTILDQIEAYKTWPKKILDKIRGLIKKIDKFKLAGSLIKHGINYAAGGSLSLLNLSSETIISNLKQQGLEVKSEQIESLLKMINSNELSIRKDINDFYKEFDELLSKTNLKRIVIYIDELDRCSPSTILDVLEAIRLFLFVDKTSFVIGADERHISYAVKTKFKDIPGIQIDIGNEYLEKLIQYPIRIPRVDKQTLLRFIFSLFAESELSAKEFQILKDQIKTLRDEDFINYEISHDVLKELFEEKYEKLSNLLNIASRLSMTLAHQYNGNPRQCKRFLNMLSMREQMAKIRSIDLKKEIIAKLMLLELFKPTIFEELINIQDPDLGYCEDLKNMELGLYGQVKNFNFDKNDEWFKNWCNQLPNIGEEDLRPYFYFIKEQASFSMNVENKLSSIASMVFKKLSSGGQQNISQSIDLIKKLSPGEIEIISDKFKNIILSKEEIDNKFLEAYLVISGSSEESCKSAIAFLLTLDMQKVNTGHAGLFFKYLENLGGDNFDKLIAILVEKNPKLKRSIKLFTGGK